MARVFKRTLAEQDLINIWLYSFHNWGEGQADKYLDSLEEAFKLLRDTPLLCRERQEFSFPVRIYHHAHHMIIYLGLEDGIDIIRVLHESMDIKGQLDEEGRP